MLQEVPRGRFPELESEYLKLDHKLYYHKDYFRFDENGRCSCGTCSVTNDKRKKMQKILDKEALEELY